jgi:hypothetical protein
MYVLLILESSFRLNNYPESKGSITEQKDNLNILARKSLDIPVSK